MMEMLKHKSGQYDETVIKALINSVSFYPIGVYVYLSSGKLGVVIDTVPNDPRHPVVQLVNEKEADGSPKSVKSDEELNKIVRVLTTNEQKEVMDSIRAQMEKDAKAKAAPQTAGDEDAELLTEL